MSVRHAYPPGVPCWVETWRRDATIAHGFYAQLFGWQLAEAGTAANGYATFRFRGHPVAGIGRGMGGGLGAPAWLTLVRVNDLESAIDRTRAAGGRLHHRRDRRPAGRAAEILDPAGALIGLWEAEAHQGASLVNEAAAWALSSLRTTDPAAARAFYWAVFGWRAESWGSDGETTLFRLPGYVGGIPDQPVPRDVVAIMTPLRSGPAGPGGAHWAVDFWVDDPDAVAWSAQQLGGSVLLEPYTTPGFRSATLADPAGAVFTVSARLARQS
jgi:predicted enzyme related to lactoylglutathione lyase